MNENRIIALLHGCNLNLLGERDPEHYGNRNLGELECEFVDAARRHGIRCVTFQTNHEGELIEKIHELRKRVDGMVINPGAWTHYSYALHDALEMVVAPVVEVHLSDIASREEKWRRRSVISDVCDLTISGKGMEGYKEALAWLVKRFEAGKADPSLRSE